MTTCEERFRPLRIAADAAIASRNPEDIDDARTDLVAFTRDPVNASCDEQRREARQLIIRLDLAEQPTREEMTAFTERIEASLRANAARSQNKTVRKASKKKKPR